MQTRAIACSRLASYRAVVAGVLADDIVTDEELAFLARYRRAHAITAEEHSGTLRAMGVSVADYNFAMRDAKSLGEAADNFSHLASVLMMASLTRQSVPTGTLPGCTRGGRCAPQGCWRSSAGMRKVRARE